MATRCVISGVSVGLLCAWPGAAAYLDKDSRPDLVVFDIDNSDGENQGYYRVGWDLSTEGKVKGWTPRQLVPGWFGSENQDGGVAVADLDGNGQPDLVVFHIDHPGVRNQGYYRIVSDAGFLTQLQPTDELTCQAIAP